MPRSIDAYVRGLPRPGAAASRLPALPDLDVAQRRGRGLRRLAAASTTPAIADPERKAGFYGLDIYSLGASIEAVLALSRQGRSAKRRGSRASVTAASSPGSAEPARYGRMALSARLRRLREAGRRALTDLLRKRLDYLAKDGEAFFDAEQNARIVAGAEQYYRAMYYGDAAESWNLRDQHMFDTLERLLAAARARAPRRWSGRTTPISATRAFTEMGQVRGEHNIGAAVRASVSARMRR